MSNVNFKTSLSDAQNMARLFYQTAGVANPSTAALAHWAAEIQHDGSQPAYDNFKTGTGQDAQSRFNPQTLAANAQAYQQKNGFNVYQPNAQTGQLAGTNTKNLGGTLDANKSWLQPLIEGATGLIPGVGPALAAAEGGMWNYADTHNLGNAALGAAGGYGMGSLGSMAGGALGVGGGASGAASAGADAASMNPADLAKMADAGGGSSASSLGGFLDDGTNDYAQAMGTDAATMNPADLAKMANAGGGAGSASSGVGSNILKSLGLGGSGGNNDSGSGLNLGSILSGLGGAANAYTNYTQSQQSAADREAQLAAQQAEFNRTQGATEGMDAASLQKSVNNAPLRDKAQYMMMARLGAPPSALAPRDITHGATSVLNGSATGGIAPTMNAMSNAAQSYTPGAGGVNTNVDQTLINRFMNPQNTVSKIPGGNTLPNGPTYPNTPYTQPAPITPPAQPQAPSGTSANPATPPLPTTPPTPVTPTSPMTPTSGGGAQGAPPITAPTDDWEQMLKSKLGAQPLTYA